MTAVAFEVAEAVAVLFAAVAVVTKMAPLVAVEPSQQLAAAN